MKILIFYHSMNQLGGAPKIYAQMASHWTEDKGYDVTILNHFGRECSIYEISPKVKIITACPLYRGNPGKVSRSVLSPFLLPKLVQTINQEKPDVIIINNAPYYGLLLGTLASKLLKTPFIIWKHSGVHMPSSPMYKVTRRICFPLANAIVMLTEGDTITSTNKNTFVIKNPYTPVSPANIEKKEKIVLNIGRLVEQKSLNHLLEAWAVARPQVKDWKLQIVGDGELRNSLENLSHSLGIAGSVNFEGATALVDEYYEKAAFFVMSSMHEGLPVVLIEALSHNLPLISYDCPYGPASIIENGKNGILVKNGSIDELAAAIIRLATDEQLRTTFAANASAKMKEFSIKPISKQWDKLFSDITQKNF